MPTIPVAQNDVELRALPGGGLQAGNFGTGPSLEPIARGLSDLSEQASSAQRQVLEAGTRDFINQYQMGAGNLLYNGDNPYTMTQGKGALDGRADTERQLRRIKDDILSKTAPGFQRDAVTTALTAHYRDDMLAVGRHAQSEGRQYNIGETTSQASSAFITGANNYLNPKASEENFATGMMAIDRLAELQGWGPEQTASNRLKAISGARKDVASRIIAENPDGPRGGLAYLDAHKDQFTSDDAAYVSHYARSQADYYTAQAHKAQVEARQAKRDQDADDRHLVEDYMTAAGIGPRPPAETAAAMAAAGRLSASTGSEGPRLRVAKVATENGVRVAYQNATPAELQARINELAPHTLGDNPDLNAVTELGTLQSMRSQSDTQLKNDPLSWAASHMGINAGQINWNDSGSISQRISVASRVAARTGYPPKILTQDEASRLAATAADPDKGKQAGLIFDLAKLGTQYASIAARQIAPSDHRLAGLVGLATVPNRGVAQALVSKALQGPEIIKGNPKIISSNFDSTFQGSVGNLFRLMPGAQNGVREIARNLLATNAFMSGIHEAADTTGDKGTVLASINGALGQYNDHGVLRGGIGAHSGKPTILPEGFSQQDFDATIARSNAKQVLGASNGAPAWGNGKAITNTKDLWVMEMVPVGNGRYRFFDGSGYVARKDGGFFELDLNRMR